jgi:signal transduction histidine kinase
MGFLKFTKSMKEENRFKVFLKELKSVEKDIRDLSHALKNDDLSSKKDFPKLLLKLLEDQSRIGNFTYKMEQEGSIAWNLVDEKIKINLFRTIQEAICNILKYAQCSEIKLRLVRRNNLVQIYIVDDGIGFDTNKRHKGIGLKNMKSRAKSIGAEISIKSVIREGTEIKISIPTKILYHEPTT